MNQFKLFSKSFNYFSKNFSIIRLSSSLYRRNMIYPTFVHFDRYYKHILLQQERLRSQLNDDFDETPYNSFDNPRKWEFTEYGKYFTQIEPYMSNCTQITIASYNTLAQYLIESNMYLYSKCEENHLSWDYRKKNLLSELKFINCDILCLQEIQAEHYTNFFYPELTKLGYDGVFKKRTRDKGDGCATFFRSQRFRLETAKGLEYYRPGSGHLLDRDNVALITVLAVKGSTCKTGSANIEGRDRAQRSSKFSTSPDTDTPRVKVVTRKQSVLKLCVANTHLLFNPKRNDVKISQLHLLMAEIDKLSRLPMEQRNQQDPTSSGQNSVEVMPILICGDFNLTPDNDIYRKFLAPQSRFTSFSNTLLSSADILSPADVRLLLSCLRTNKWSRYLELSPESAGEQRAQEPASVHPSLKHGFNLTSVYDHFKTMEPFKVPEITTRNLLTSTTVDYMLFSTSLTPPTPLTNGTATDHPSPESSTALINRKGKDGDKDGKYGKVPTRSRGHLGLLARYSLMSELEIANGFVGGLMPNAYLSSDHLCLAAKFLLYE